MKDLVIGCVRDYKPAQVAVWINSLLATGFDGDVVVLTPSLPLETVAFLHRKGVTVVDVEDLGRHIVVDRFIWMYQFLSENEDKYRYVITTDVRDVVFQSNPFKRTGSFILNEVGVFSENIRYKDETWGNENMIRSYPHMYGMMKDKQIYNAGVICGYTQGIKDFFLHIYHLSLIGQERQPDQAAMNILINMFPFESEVHKANIGIGYVANLGTALAKKEYYDKLIQKKLPQITSKGVECSFSGLFEIVHQYDRVAGLSKFYEDKFGSLD